MTVATEAQAAHTVLNRVDALQRIASHLAEEDDDRQELLYIVERDLASAAPLRPRVAATLLGLSERSVRTWVAAGILLPATEEPRLLLDVRRVQLVRSWLDDIRRAGATTTLIDEIHRRLVDATWADRADLALSIEQMRAGLGTLRVAAASARP